MAKNQARRAVSGDPANPIKGAGLAGGGKAPAFRLPRDGGRTVRLADFAGRKLVLYFYPRADTSGCTREAVDFSRLKSAFSRAATEILGISADPVAALDRFKSKHKLTIALASDELRSLFARERRCHTGRLGRSRPGECIRISIPDDPERHDRTRPAGAAANRASARQA